jgi:hypothetical protein
MILSFPLGSGGSLVGSHSSPLHATLSSSEEELKPSSNAQSISVKERGTSSVQKSKKLKCWKVRKERWKMVVGDDVEIGAIPNLLGRTTVGWFYGKIISPLALKSWLDENWVGFWGTTQFFIPLHVDGYVSFSESQGLNGGLHLGMGMGSFRTHFKGMGNFL